MNQLDTKRVKEILEFAIKHISDMESQLIIAVENLKDSLVKQAYDEYAPLEAEWKEYRVEKDAWYDAKTKNEKRTFWQKYKFSPWFVYYEQIEPDHVYYPGDVEYKISRINSMYSCDKIGRILDTLSSNHFKACVSSEIFIANDVTVRILKNIEFHLEDTIKEFIATNSKSNYEKLILLFDRRD